MIDRFLLGVGIAIFASVVIFAAVRFLRVPKQKNLPFRAWLGLAGILLAEFLLWMGSQPISVFFTPIVWTAYLLLADGMLESLTGSSRIRRDPKGFAALAFWSIPVWLVFEAYNLRLQNWVYVGLPLSWEVRMLGYGWSFATIFPGVFLTTDLVLALGIVPKAKGPGVNFSSRTHGKLILLGLVLIILPLLIPQEAGQYLFGAVWLGFIFLLDPLNFRSGRRSFLKQWESGERAPFYGLLLGGTACGILWEFWNFWALAKWHYIFPIGQDFKVFEMPLPGYLGFGPFALECFVLYEFILSLKDRLFRWATEKDQERLGRTAAGPGHVTHRFSALRFSGVPLFAQLGTRFRPG